jgi:hypothetical protein
MPPPEPTSSAFADDLAANHFDVAGADLLIGGIPLRELAARYGTPMFIYSYCVTKEDASIAECNRDSVRGSGRWQR